MWWGTGASKDQNGFKDTSFHCQRTLNLCCTDKNRKLRWHTPLHSNNVFAYYYLENCLITPGLYENCIIVTNLCIIAKERKWLVTQEVVEIKNPMSCHFNKFHCSFRYCLHRPLICGCPWSSPPGSSSGLCYTAEIRELHHPLSSGPFRWADHCVQSVLHRCQLRHRWTTLSSCSQTLFVKLLRVKLRIRD